MDGRAASGMMRQVVLEMEDEVEGTKITNMKTKIRQKMSETEGKLLSLCTSSCYPGLVWLNW